MHPRGGVLPTHQLWAEAGRPGSVGPELAMAAPPKQVRGTPLLPSASVSQHVQQTLRCFRRGGG